MILFDSHCHIDDPCFEPDMDAVFERARNAGVRAMAIAGVDVKTARKAIDIAARHPHVITAVGIHPHDAARCSPDILDCLMRMAKKTNASRPGEKPAWISTACSLRKRIRKPVSGPSWPLPKPWTCR